MLYGTREEVKNAIDELRHDEKQFETEGKICTGRERYQPPPIKKCHQYHSDKYRPMCCAAGVVAREFSGGLGSANV